VQPRRAIATEEKNVVLNGNQAVRLARALRSPREMTWPDRELTQAQLAKALSSEGRVAGATLSSWESYASYGDLDALIELYGHLRAEIRVSTSSIERRLL
jgi:hypothetical protein